MTSRWSNGSAPLVASTATALPTSSALPPPNPRTASQPASATSATPARTRSIDGSAATPNAMLEMPASVSVDRMASARDVVRPVTTRTRLAPSAASAAGTSLTRPAPNRTSAGTARSMRTTGYQSESSGDVLTYRVAWRGLAIMGATMSRHR